MIDYPAARRDDINDHLHGHMVPDPYRWLEDPHSDDTRAWSAAEAALLASESATWTTRDHWQRRLAELLGAGGVSVPAWRGDRQGRPAAGGR